MVYSTIQHPPTPTHCLYILYCTFILGREEGAGEVREKVEGQQYTSIVPSSMGGNSSQARSKMPTMNEWISSL
jgi:hypothetical protein